MRKLEIRLLRRCSKILVYLSNLQLPVAPRASAPLPRLPGLGSPVSAPRPRIPPPLPPPGLLFSGFSPGDPSPGGPLSPPASFSGGSLPEGQPSRLPGSAWRSAPTTRRAWTCLDPPGAAAASRVFLTRRMAERMRYDACPVRSTPCAATPAPSRPWWRARGTGRPRRFSGIGGLTYVSRDAPGDRRSASGARAPTHHPCAWSTRTAPSASSATGVTCSTTGTRTAWPARRRRRGTSFSDSAAAGLSLPPCSSSPSRGAWRAPSERPRRIAGSRLRARPPTSPCAIRRRA